jgi:membrane associated rhomboid family serine protease
MILDDIKQQFLKPSNSVVKLILINILVFLIIRTSGVLLELSGAIQKGYSENLITPYLGMSDVFIEILQRPWTIITAFFTHWGFLHIALNMLGLYFVGTSFSRELGDKRFLSLYLIIGTLTNIIWFFVDWAIPLFHQSQDLVIGASAAVIGVMFALATFFPNREVLLYFVIPLKFKWLAIGMVVLYFISLSGSNGGGEAGHLIGAALGFGYAKLYQQGTDATSWLSALLIKIENLFKPKPKFKVSHNSYSNTSKSPIKEINFNDISQAQIDEILDKLRISGYSSLSKEEKAILFEYSKK